MNIAPTPDDLHRYCGSAAIDPGRAVAGEWGTWRIIYTVGAYGLDIGARLRLAFRQASDWGPLQAEDSAGPGYASVETRAGGAMFRVRFDPRGHTRPWTKALLIDVVEHEIAPGDAVTITLGDRRSGSPGCRAQTFVEHPFRFVLLVDPLGTGEFVALDAPLEIDVAAGPVQRLRALAPSTVAPHTPCELSVKAEDANGNPAVDYRGTVHFSAWTGLPPYAFTAEDAGAHRFTIAGAPEGVHRVDVVDRMHGMQARSNAMVGRPAGRRIYWGDIHGQTGETLGTGPVSNYFPFARRYGALDFCAHCGNDFELDDEVFESLRREVAAHHAPGTFVTFLSYEWSGNTPGGGDHNVYFLDDSAVIHRSSSWRIPGRPFRDPTDLFPIASLYAAYRGREDVLIIPHIGGRRADLAVIDPALSPFIEIASVHGWFEWFAREAIERGLCVGFVAGSDDHTGRPGASYPAGHEFPVRGGLVAAWADSLTREGLWQAFRSRRVYATSGERIFLSFSINGCPMGETVQAAGAVDLEIDAAGTAGIECIDVWRGTDLWHHEMLGRGDPASHRLAVTWRGARNQGRARLLRWVGHARLSSGEVSRAEIVGDRSAFEGDLVVGAQDVRWRSGTAGNAHRIVLTVAATDNARMALNVGPLAVEFPLAEVGARTAWRLTGGIDCEVDVRWMPLGSYPTDVHRALHDPQPPRGRTPYWVRITQEDGETAWSSPVFVDR